MLMPKSDPIFVRASVSDKCNLTCVYCPKKEGMENRVPPDLAGHYLTAEQYARNLAHIARSGVSGISFTGGEPTLNPDLRALVRSADGMFDRVELTSNGFRLPEMLPELALHLDVLKISLDTMDPALGKKITQSPHDETARAAECIIAACEMGLTVGVNVVVLRSTVPEIDPIIQFSREVNKRGYPGKVYVSLLDFYFSPERRDIWEAEFLPIEMLAQDFERRYGQRTAQQRFGCTFYWFDAKGVEVRFKDSLGATHRAKKCEGCKQYCQEGVYGLKHSVEGWVTSCPNGDPGLGVHLRPGISDVEADSLLGPLIRDIQTARPNPNSFDALIGTHALKPNRDGRLPPQSAGGLVQLEIAK